jgi:hypothetical protein
MVIFSFWGKYLSFSVSLGDEEKMMNEEEAERAEIIS